MCTAATYKTDGFYFGRTLDYEFSYGDEIVVTPRRFPLAFSGGKALSEHFALLGMAHVADGYPLYYDAMNEKGLCMAGLNFVGNAAYAAPRGGEGDVAQFEFIPWVLAQCASVSEARVLLGKTNLTGTPFSAALPAAQLHWLLADKDECVTIESTADGLHVYDNPAGVLTNNPPFPQQLFRLNDYQSLSPRQPENTFAPALDLRSYSRGMGALGLPVIRKNIISPPCRSGMRRCRQRWTGITGCDRGKASLPSNNLRSWSRRSCKWNRQERYCWNVCQISPLTKCFPGNSLWIVSR